MNYNNADKQNGAIALVMVFVVIVIITGMLVTVLSVSSSSVNDSSLQNFRTNSNYLAESAVERAAYELSNANCVASGPHSLNTGTFEILNPVTEANGDCTAMVKGVNNGLVSTFTVTVSGSATGPHGSFAEGFPSIGDFGTWTDKVLGNSSLIDLDYFDDDSYGLAGGSMRIVALPVKFNPKSLKGSIKRLLTPYPSVDASTNFDITLTYSFNLKSFNSDPPGGSIANQSIELLLVNGNTEFSIWNSVDYPGVMDNTNDWTVQSPITGSKVIAGNGIVYDEIMVKFVIEAPAKFQSTYIYLDDIQLSW